MQPSRDTEKRKKEEENNDMAQPPAAINATQTNKNHTNRETLYSNSKTYLFDNN